MGFLQIIFDIVTSQIFIGSLTAWCCANAIKMSIYYRHHHRINFRLLVGTGGMPSSHSALVSAVATMVGLKEGFESSVFMVAMCFALIIMTDAAGVRRAAGRQAAMLNRVVDDYYAGKAIPQERLKELLGHTPLEVIAGCLLGIAVAIAFKSLPKII